MASWRYGTLIPTKRSVFSPPGDAGLRVVSGELLAPLSSLILESEFPL